MKANRINEWRQRRGLTIEQLSERAGLSTGYVSRILSGDRDWNERVLEQIATALQCDVTDLLARPRVPVIGRVGAGAEVHSLEAYPNGHGAPTVTCPSNLEAAKTVAVMVVGDSMYPEIDEGWYLYYSRADGDYGAAEVIGRRCVVKVAGDGPTLVKRVGRAPTAGRYTLLSSNAPPIEDAELEWAAPVRAILPPDLAAPLLVDDTAAPPAPTTPRTRQRRNP